ncbi:MAG TPA: tRNA (guanosine(37)-N1)-methyltransferase TrmD [Terriglobales bacterium]
MRFDLITIFPDFFTSPLAHGVVARARAAGRLEIAVHNLRDYAPPPHHITDDRPFGGGEGMVMKPEPIYDCLQSLLGHPPAPGADADTRVLLLSAQGRQFRQADARRYAACRRLILICGRYEGVDERVAGHMVDEEVSIGDFVLSGGELAACLVLDATARLLPGVLGHEQSAINESFSTPGQLDCPHYTRPLEFRGWGVPEVLRGGNHAAIARWRREQAESKTRRLRPDL